MSRIMVIDGQSKTGNAGDVLQLGLERAYHAQNIVLKFTVNHTNALALTTTDYEFWADVIQSIRIDAGAGSDFIDLPVTDLMLRMLKDRGALIETVTSTVGAQVSTMSLVIDFSSIGMLSPKDTILNTAKYNHLNAVIKVGAGDTVTSLTIDSVAVAVREQQIINMKPLTDATGALVPELHRSPIRVTKEVVSDTNNFTIDLPFGQKFSQVMIYAKDGDKIVSDVIGSVKMKIKNSYRWVDTLSDLNALNRLSHPNLIGNAMYDGVCVMDVGQGSWTPSVNTNMLEENNGKLELAVTKGAYADLEIVAVFETLALAK